MACAANGTVYELPEDLDLIQKLDESAAAFLAEMDAGQHGSSESEGSDGEEEEE